MGVSEHMRTVAVEQCGSCVDIDPSQAATPKLKVLQVCSEPFSNLGGVALIVSRLIEQMPRSFQVSLASPDERSEDLPSHLRERIAERLVIPRQKWSVAEKQEFVRGISSLGYDLVHFHGGTLSFDAHLPWRSPLHAFGRLSMPWIYSNHCAPKLATGLYPNDYSTLKKPLKLILAFISLAWIATTCHRQIFDSDENRIRMARYFPWAKGRFTTIYHSGIEGEPPPPVVRDKVLTIGNLGHIGWRKGQVDLLEAFSILAPKYPELQLFLVGGGTEDDCATHIKREVCKRGLESKVFLPGPTRNLKPFWDVVDIYVQPSHYEGAPMALMEALWNGKPAVGTSVSGIPEIIEHEITGLLVDAKKPAALAGALERLLQDFSLRQRLSVAGSRRIMVKKMTKLDMAAEHWRVYCEVLSSQEK
jgi:glycosyltransferase involved in cell wall biosynthesis